MTDKEKILAEIERRLKENMNKARSRGCLHTIAANEDKEMLSFINSLPEEPVSEDLEEAMKRAADETKLTKAKNGHPFFSEVDFNMGFSNGAQWQKEVLLKDAITAHVFGREMCKSLFCFKVDGDDHLVGHEVKVIIVKEN